MPPPLPANCDETQFVPFPGTQPQRRTPTSQDAAMADAHGPGADLIDALEAGYFDRIGLGYEPSEMAGVWAEA